jgi:hypothetical protein
MNGIPPDIQQLAEGVRGIGILAFASFVVVILIGGLWGRKK